MKKSYLMIVAAATLFAACSNSDTFKQINDQSDNSISFATYTSKQTRASGTGAAENSGQTARQSDLEVHQKSFAVWGYKNAVNRWTRVFNKQLVNYSTTAATGWAYNPLMFWDKAATGYDFYAATPADLAWVMNDGGTTYAHSTATDAYTLSLASHEVDGASLNITDANLPSSPTTGATATWLKSDGTTNYDIMISNDITGYKTYSSAPVNFEFMHILSRLNIAVKIANILDTELGTSGTKDYVVKLKSIKVFNLKKNGQFNEANASGTTLSSGTTTRWSDVSTQGDRLKFAEGVGFTSSDASGVQLSTTKKYFYQTLVIPQNVDYQLVSIDGLAHSAEKYYGVEEYNYVNGTSLSATEYAELIASDATKEIKPATNQLHIYTGLSGLNGNNTDGHFDNCSAPYIEICYTIMPTYGTNANVVEEFTQYYNLAAAFGKNLNSATGDPAVNQVPFNEGWMNNLIITINPVSINFDAEVIEWKPTTPDAEVDVI